MSLNSSADESLRLDHASSAWNVFDLFVIFFFMEGLATRVHSTDLLRKERLKAATAVMLVQYLLLPSVAFGMTVALGLRKPIAVGLLCICCSPSGTTSNIFSQMFRCDMALSITLTMAGCVFSFWLLPLSLGFFLDRVQSDEWTTADLEMSFAKLFGLTSTILGGIVAGLLLQRLRTPRLLRALRVLGTVSMITFLVKSMLLNAGSAVPFWKLGTSEIAAVFAPIVVGHTSGLLFSLLARLERPSAVTVAVEASLQNKVVGITLCRIVLRQDPAAMSVAISVPLLYTTFAITLNGVLLVLYWKVGWTRLRPDARWYMPILNIVAEEPADSVVAPAPRPEQHSDGKDTAAGEKGAGGLGNASGGADNAMDDATGATSNLSPR
jgi:BASS family bile acid:Na+ symporter